MTTRQMLEDAARAAGIVIHAPSQKRRDDAGYGHVGLWTTEQTCWNPLTDDGDALRLAVKLFLWKAVRDGYQHVDSDCDFYAATRLAITRAAASIGAKMREAAKEQGMKGRHYTPYSKDDPDRIRRYWWVMFIVFPIIGAAVALSTGRFFDFMIIGFALPASFMEAMRPQKREREEMEKRKVAATEESSP